MAALPNLCDARNMRGMKEPRSTSWARCLYCKRGAEGMINFDVYWKATHTNCMLVVLQYSSHHPACHVKGGMVSDLFHRARAITQNERTGKGRKDTSFGTGSAINRRHHLLTLYNYDIIRQYNICNSVYSDQHHSIVFDTSCSDNNHNVEKCA